MKKILKIIGLIIILLIIACLPIISIFKVENLMCSLGMDKSTTVNLIIGFLPLIFSIILFVFSYIIEIHKNQKESYRENKDIINTQIDNYNLIMIKALKRFNSLMNELEYVLEVKNELMAISEFAVFIEMWNRETKNNVEYSNNADLRNLIRQKISEFIPVYRNSQVYDAPLEFMGHIDMAYDEKETFDNNDSIYILNLNNFIDLNKQDRNLLNTYCNHFGVGKDNKRIIEEFNKSAVLYNTCFETEIRNRNINDEKLKGLIYKIFLKLLYLNEFLLLEIFFLENFQTVLSLNFTKYYETQKENFKNLNKCVKSEIVLKNEFINEFIKKDIIYSYYKI